MCFFEMEALEKTSPRSDGKKIRLTGELPIPKCNRYVSKKQSAKSDAVALVGIAESS